MTYNDALEYIGSRLRFGIKPGLSRTEELLEKLGNPQKKLNCIHVAGTNGKGSVCAMISAVLTASGAKTGLYTSPYISCFRERMQINSEMISEAELSDIIAFIRPYADTIDDITEFELITCAAFLWFYEKKCDVVVLETGLGGRFDSTNIIESPICSVITKIGLDHTSILGSTIEEIAFEKAGIIKSGCPVVSAIQRDEAMSAISQTAQSHKSPLIKAGRCTPLIESISGTDAKYDNMQLHIPLAGSHQLENAAAAIEALRIAGIDDNTIISGIANASIPARLEYLEESPSCIIDGAHNPDGADTLAYALDNLTAGRRKIAVIGMLADKDYNDVIAKLAPQFDIAVTADGFSNRELSSEELSRLMDPYTKTVIGGTFDKALAAAQQLADDNDIIVVCGSLYLAGALRPLLIEHYTN